ncbi:hypothetical protein J416_02751 [Gracilibacillus halophilus YIM-C55.5]|uniref:Spore coat protein YsxE n=1 Tax=Gracilibacillus halophilus YIM-C55.5 TaxID=1308866 RepID=N4WCD8_9BACI|nr:hypothetical protein [Gracilibacillus halophilus]ENH97938.1 hypothetical protein J416_02751 [Gracilibacillus halophilus YIM-C55.5]
MNDINLTKYYPIQPIDQFTITDRITQVRTKDQLYALRKARLSISDVGRWEALCQFVQQQYIYGYIPVYQTHQQTFYVVEHDTVYYLMPWIETNIPEQDQPIHEYADIFHSLGKLHASTWQKQNLNRSQLQNLDHNSSFIQTIREQLLSMIRFFEAKRFMSPLELQACMYYRDIETVINEVEHWQNFYQEALQQTDYVHYCLCHGHVKPSHHLHGRNHQFFINYEFSQFASPISDLAQYFSHVFTYHDTDLEKLQEGFMIYQQYLPINDVEKTLLIIQLLSPLNYLQQLHDYVQQSETPLVQQVIQLEQEYRRLMFALEWQELMQGSLSLQEEA